MGRFKTLARNNGIANAIIVYVIILFVSILPLVIIDVNFWLSSLFVLIEYFFPITSIVFWVWGFIVAVSKTQNWLTISYYVCTVIVFIPFYKNTVIGFFSRFKKKPTVPEVTSAEQLKAEIDALYEVKQKGNMSEEAYSYIKDQLIDSYLKNCE